MMKIWLSLKVANISDHVKIQAMPFDVFSFMMMIKYPKHIKEIDMWAWKIGLSTKHHTITHISQNFRTGPSCLDTL